MGLHIREVSGPGELRSFIFLPEKIHAHHRHWVPPIYLDERSNFNPTKNHAFSHCDTLLLLAHSGRRAVGRIMGIINHRYNRYRGEKTARFACLEAYEDGEVVAALLKRVEDWAREAGMERVIGPYGFSDQDPSGFLVQGFEYPPTIATYYNFEWMPRMLEKMGYEKEVDYVTYRIEVTPEQPETYHRMVERILKRGNFEILKFRSRREAVAWAKPAFRLMNVAYAEEAMYGFCPLEEEEMDRLISRYFSFLDPRFLLAVRAGGELAGFVIGIPDFTEGIRRARGRLSPLGLLRIWLSMRNTRQLVLLLGAIKREYRGLGIDLLLMMEMWNSARKAGMLLVDTHHQMENNRKIRAVSEWISGALYKRHRVYRKPL